MKGHRDNFYGGASVGLHILSCNLTSVGIAHCLKLLKSSRSKTHSAIPLDQRTKDRDSFCGGFGYSRNFILWCK